MGTMIEEALKMLEVDQEWKRCFDEWVSTFKVTDEMRKDYPNFNWDFQPRTELGRHMWLLKVYSQLEQPPVWYRRVFKWFGG